jgi:hypothetical protein
MRERLQLALLDAAGSLARLLVVCLLAYHAARWRLGVK